MQVIEIFHRLTNPHSSFVKTKRRYKFPTALPWTGCYEGCEFVIPQPYLTVLNMAGCDKLAAFGQKVATSRLYSWMEWGLSNRTVTKEWTEQNRFGRKNGIHTFWTESGRKTGKWPIDRRKNRQILSHSLALP